MSHSDALTALVDANPVHEPSAVVDQEAMDRAWRTIVASPPGHAIPRQRSRWVRRLAPVGMAAATAIVLGLTVQTTDKSDSSLPGAANALADVIEAPSAALHFVDDGPHAPDASGGPDITREETWASLDGNIQRTRTTYADGTFQDLRSERRDDQYQVTVYRSKTHELYIAPWLKLQARPAPDATQLSVATIRQYARAVDAGHARLDGRSEVGGRTTLRIVDTGEGPAKGTVWFVSEDDAPALLQIQPPCRGSSGACPPPTRFSNYEISDDRSDLQLPQHPDAHVVNGENPTG